MYEKNSDMIASGHGITIPCGNHLSSPLFACRRFLAKKQLLNSKQSDEGRFVF